MPTCKHPAYMLGMPVRNLQDLVAQRASSLKGEDKDIYTLFRNRDRTCLMAESSVSEHNHDEEHLCSPPGQLCSTDGRGPVPESWAEALTPRGQRLLGL